MEKIDIAIDGLTKSYDGHKVYDAFDYRFKAHEIVSILGPSGCGKTTLLNAMAGITDYEKGSISGVKSDTLGYIFQEPRLIPWLTVAQNLSFALSHILDQKTYHKNRDQILADLNLENKLKRYPHQLSGGEQQRVALTRAFLMPSDLLLMDEAFKGLDLVTKQALIQAFISLWHRNPKTVIAVSHDISEAVMLSDCVLLFSKSPVKVLSKIDIPVEKRRRTDEKTQLELVEYIKNQIPKVL